MIGLIGKYWKVLLDALIIIALIVAVFIWNPFNLFGQELEFKSTANVVSDVKKIGQLVTAEYYGEVVASLGEARLNFLQEDNLADRSESFFIKLKKDIYNTYQKEVEEPVKNAKNKNQRNRAERQGKRKALKDIEDNYGKEYLEKNALLEKFRLDTLDVILLYIVENQISEPVSEDLNKFKKENKREKFRQKRLENLFDEIARQATLLSEDDFKVYLEDGFDDASHFTSYFYSVSEEDIKRRDQLAMIGRGVVKAGFDFSTLDDRNFYYDEARNTLHIFGAQPTILNYDINPWFIPQRAVPGFDIVEAGRNANFMDAVKVKSYCRDKLKASAMQAGILDQALLYGEEVMGSFFSLVLDKPDVQVRFHDNLEKAYLEQLTQDKLITPFEIALIQSIEDEFLTKVDTTSNEVLKNAYRLQLSEIFTALHSLSILMPDSSQVAFNFFSYHLYKVIKEDTISADHYNQISQSWRFAIDTIDFLPDTLMYYKHWFSEKGGILNPYQFIYDYNTLLFYLAEHKIIENDKGLKPFCEDSLIYLIHPTREFVETIMQKDTLDTAITLVNLCPPPGTMQTNDIAIYEQYLQHRQLEYNKKSWVYKWRDKIHFDNAELREIRAELKDKMSIN